MKAKDLKTCIAYGKIKAAEKCLQDAANLLDGQLRTNAQEEAGRVSSLADKVYFSLPPITENR